MATLSGRPETRSARIQQRGILRWIHSAAAGSESRACVGSRLLSIFPPVARLRLARSGLSVARYVGGKSRSRATALEWANYDSWPRVRNISVPRDTPRYDQPRKFSRDANFPLDPGEINSLRRILCGTCTSPSYSG